MTRDASGRFIKGASGNPAGRPATPGAVRDAAGAHTMAAIEILARVLHDEECSLSMRFRAAQSILRAAKQGDEPEEDGSNERAEHRALQKKMQQQVNEGMRAILKG